MPSGTLCSANISPDEETGIAGWGRQQFINRFSFYRDSSQADKTVDFIKDFNAIMPWTMYAGMTDQNLGAIYVYLRTVKPVKQAIEKFQPASISQK